jgi:NO-binding membrane sensor protein with MHYT domain
MNHPLLAGADTGPTVHQFFYGTWLLLLVCAIALIGSVVGLACTRNAVHATGSGKRLRWLGLGAFSIGGVALWLMHYVAMLGFAVDGTPIRFHLGWTLAALLVSVGVTFAALLVAARGFRLARVIPAGVLLGLAASLMHYVAMRAVHLPGEVLVDQQLLMVSVLVAVVGATGALWLAMGTRSDGLRVGSAVLGLAVVGMHYTAVAAIAVEPTPGAPRPAGHEVFTILMPALVLGVLALAVPIGAVILRRDAAAVDLDRESDLFAAEAVTEAASREAAAQEAEAQAASVRV